MSSSERSNDDAREIGRRLAERRDQLRLDQETLAQKAGLSRAYISRLERGLVPSPKLQDLRQVARALGVPVTALTDPPTASLANEDEIRRFLAAQIGEEDALLFARILERLRGRGPLDRRVILDVVDSLVRTLPGHH